MTQHDETPQPAFPVTAVEGIEPLARRIWDALQQWDAHLAPFWREVHRDHPERETEAFTDVLRDYTYGLDMAGYYVVEGKDSLLALAHTAGAGFQMVRSDHPRVSPSAGEQTTEAGVPGTAHAFICPPPLTGNPQHN